MIERAAGVDAETKPVSTASIAQSPFVHFWIRHSAYIFRIELLQKDKAYFLPQNLLGIEIDRDRVPVRIPEEHFHIVRFFGAQPFIKAQQGIFLMSQFA